MTIKSDEYRKHYEEFAQSVEFAVRAWYHQFFLDRSAENDRAVLAALNKAPRFWLDQRYSATQTTIIFLGKIFDGDGSSHSVDRFLKAANEGKDHFSKAELRKRKIESGGKYDVVDEYIRHATELNHDDLKAIRVENKRAKAIWKRIKPLRDKVYAHNAIMSDVQRNELFENVKMVDINNILQILLNISNAMWQAEFNGRKPDFAFDYKQPIEWAKQDIEELVGSLLGRQAN